VADEDGDKVTTKTTVFTHVLCAALAGLPVSTTYGGNATQCSHLCESFWRYVQGDGNEIHPRCVNPRHIVVERPVDNRRRRTCGRRHARRQVGEEGTISRWCTCGSSPPCLNLFGEAELYEQQRSAVEELFSVIHALNPNHVPLPSLGDIKLERADEEEAEDYDPHASPREIVRRRLLRRIARQQQQQQQTDGARSPAPLLPCQLDL
jgi:hypothetical protein